MKNIIRIVACIMTISISTAAEISFSPDTGNIQPGCLVAVDIMIDTDGQAIAATDVIIETTLEYVDFVPSKKLFPYFFPPQVGEYSIHIIGFVAGPKSTIIGSGSIGKLYLKQRNSTDADGKLKLYFAGTGETHDSNLSILGGIDILDRVGKGLYSFVPDGTCSYPADYKIVGGFSHMSAEEGLNKTINQIKWKQSLTRRNIISLFIFIIIITVIFIYKNRDYSGETQ